jgi:hypothetical protein
MALSAPQEDGDRLNPVDINGHVLVVCPIEYLPHVQTVHTKKDEQSPAIRVNVAVLTQNAEGGGHPVYKGVLWFNVKLYNGLKRQIGETILGKMGQGQGNPGQNPPWQLENMLTDPAWAGYAEQWLATPAGVEFEADSVTMVNQAAASQQVAQAGQATAPAAAPPSVASVAPNFAPPGAALPNIPPTPPAGLAPPAAPQAPAPVAPPAAPPSAPAPAAAPPAMDFATMFAGLPPEEQAKMIALAQQQGQASS